MIIVGERINSTRKTITRAMQEHDSEFILNEAQRQWDAGATYLDVNTAMMRSEESQTMTWVVELIQAEIPEALIAIDSANPAAIEAGFKVHKGRALLNSINMEKDRIKSVVPLIREFRPRVVALTIDDSGVTQEEEKRFELGVRLIELLMDNDVERDDIFIDPLIFPVSAELQAGNVSLNIMGRLKEAYSDVHMICGLSNISFGLPERKLINQVYMVMAMGRGLDGAIIDPLDRRLMANITTARTLLGQDKACRGFLKTYRSGGLKLEPNPAGV
ncbi:MAG: dihydropteroate synthase [Hyphomicrobiales bacterium]|nr:dihydropteroate synthase [Hyphomicrobiales bacterium]